MLEAQRKLLTPSQHGPNTTRQQLASRAERHRLSIRTGMAIGYLNRVVEGTEEGDAQRIRAAKILLDKVIPDATVPREIPNEIKDVSALSAHILLAKLEGAGRGDTVTVSDD